MLRITTTDERPRTVTFKVEGRIVCGWIAELDRECHGFLDRGKRGVMDFSAVTFVDGEAVAMLKQLLQENVEIANCSALIKSLLTEDETQ